MKPHCACLPLHAEKALRCCDRSTDRTIGDILKLEAIVADCCEAVIYVFGGEGCDTSSSNLGYCPYAGNAEPWLKLTRGSNKRLDCERQKRMRTRTYYRVVKTLQLVLPWCNAAMLVQ